MPTSFLALLTLLSLCSLKAETFLLNFGGSTFTDEGCAPNIDTQEREFYNSINIPSWIALPSTQNGLVSFSVNDSAQNLSAKPLLSTSKKDSGIKLNTVLMSNQSGAGSSPSLSLSALCPALAQYDESALKSGIRQINGNVLEFKFEGLNPRLPYQVILYGGYVVASGRTGTQPFTLIGKKTESQTLNINTQTQVLDWQDVYPNAQGELILKMEATAGTGGLQDNCVNFVKITSQETNLAPSSPKAPEIANLGRRASTYIPVGQIWNPPADKLNWDHLTDVVFFLGDVRADGTVPNPSEARPDVAGDSVRSQKLFDDLGAICRQKGIRLFYGLAGSYSGRIDALFDDTTRRSLLIAECARVAQLENVIGIDLDFEYPTTLAHTQKMNAFFRDLKLRLGETKMLTAAVGASWMNGNSHGGISGNFVNKYLHWLNLMSYGEIVNTDYARCVSDIAQYVGNGSTPAKIVLGLPFFAKKNVNGVVYNPGYNGLISQVSGNFNPDIDVTDISVTSGGQTFNQMRFNGRSMIARKTELGAYSANGTVAWHGACDARTDNTTYPYNEVSLGVAVGEQTRSYVTMIENFESLDNLRFSGDILSCLTYDCVEGERGLYLSFGNSPCSIQNKKGTRPQEKWELPVTRLNPAPQPLDTLAARTGGSNPLPDAVIVLDIKVINPGSSLTLEMEDLNGQKIRYTDTSQIKSAGWKRYTLKRSNFSASSTFDYTALGGWSLSSQNCELIVDNLVLLAGKPSAVTAWDDYNSQYKRAFPSDTPEELKAPEACPDRDGIPNLIKYALGKKPGTLLSPLTPEVLPPSSLTPSSPPIEENLTSSLPVSSQETPLDNQSPQADLQAPLGHLALRIQYDPLAKVRLLGEASESGLEGTWSSEWVESSDDRKGLFLFYDKEPLGTRPSRFLRLKVELDTE